MSRGCADQGVATTAAGVGAAEGVVEADGARLFVGDTGTTVCLAVAEGLKGTVSVTVVVAVG